MAVAGLEDRETDVLVVGSGAGGLTAAVLANTYGQDRQIGNLQAAFVFGLLHVRDIGREDRRAFDGVAIVAVERHHTQLTSNVELLTIFGAQIICSILAAVNGSVAHGIALIIKDRSQCTDTRFVILSAVGGHRENDEVGRAGLVPTIGRLFV